MGKGFYFLSVALVSLSLVSCGNHSKNDSDTVDYDSVAGMEATAEYYGIYKGKIPSETENGEPFESTLSLNSDNSYALHASDGTQKFSEQGDFAVQDGVVILFLANQKPSYFKLEEGSLRALDDNQDPITNDMTYVLVQVDEF